MKVVSEREKIGSLASISAGNCHVNWLNGKALARERHGCNRCIAVRVEALARVPQKIMSVLKLSVRKAGKLTRNHAHAVIVRKRPRIRNAD